MEKIETPVRPHRTPEIEGILIERGILPERE